MAFYQSNWNEQREKELLADLGDLENIFRGIIYNPLLELGAGWLPLVRGSYLFMNPAAKGEHEPVGLATGKYGKGTVTYCCMVASQDWIIGDRGSWGSNGGKLFERGELPPPEFYTAGRGSAPG